MKVLFFNPEQYVDWQDEPGNYQVRLPILNCGRVGEHRDYVYQRVLKSDGRDAMNLRALAEFREFRPDIVINSLTWWRQCLDWRTLRDIRAEGGRVVTIFWDTWLDSLPHEVELTLNSDVIVIMDSLTSYLKFRLLAEQQGRPNSVAFSPIAVFTDIVRPLEVEKNTDVLLLGSNEGGRVGFARKLAHALAEKGVALSRLGGLVDDEAGPEDKSARWIGWDDYARAINGAKIALSSQTQPDRYQIKGKIFDFLACGTFCLTDDNPELRRIVPDDCLAYYTNEADCVAKILYFLDNEEERQRVAANGHAWFKENYDYKIFWAELLGATVDNSHALPAHLSFDEMFRRYFDAQDLITRSQLFALDHLGRVVASGKEFRRLPVCAEGAYQGINILTVDDRWTVACNSLVVDFVEVDGGLFALVPGEGLVEVAGDGAHVGGQTQLFAAQSVEHAKQIIDVARIKDGAG